MSRKLPKLLITHPEFPVPNLDTETVRQLAQGGAFIEFMAADTFPMNGVALARMIELIEAATPARSVISTDAGQPFNPRPPEMMRVFVQCLYEKGFSEETIKQMTVTNPAFLLGQ